MAKKTKTKLPVESVCSPAKLTAEDKARQRRYEVEDGLRTIQRADEIRKDKALLGDIKRYAKDQVNALNKVAK